MRLVCESADNLPVTIIAETSILDAGWRVFNEH